MSKEQPVLGLDVARCSGCTGETSSALSPDPLPVMAKVCLVHTGQRAFHCGCCGDPLTEYVSSCSPVFVFIVLTSWA